MKLCRIEGSRYAKRVIVWCLIVALSTGCTKTYRPPKEGAPALSFHPVVERGSPGAMKFFCYIFGEGFLQPDQELSGIRVQRVTGDPQMNTNWINIVLSAEDARRVKEFATAHPAKHYAVRFSSTPLADPKSLGPNDYDGIFVVVDLTRLQDSGEFPHFASRPTSEEMHQLCKTLIGSP